MRGGRVWRVRPRANRSRVVASGLLFSREQELLRDTSNLEAITMRRWTAVSHTVAFGVAAAALLAVACDRPERLVSSAGKPMYWFGQTCPAAKMTGGGPNDYPPGGPDKNPPPSPEYQTFGAHPHAGGPGAKRPRPRPSHAQLAR